MRSWRSAPDRDRALANYARLAATYSAATRGINPVRADAVTALGLRAGDVVFDVGCGTGELLLALSQRVGPTGRVVGIEQSPAMAAHAVRAALGLEQVEVVVAPVEEARIDARPDALLFCFAHDVLQNPTALARLFARAHPGTRVVVAGLCLLGWWATPVNLWSAWRARRYLTTFRGLRCPWRHLLPYCPDLRVLRRYFPGTSCLAAGHVAIRRAAGSPPRQREAARACGSEP